MKRISSITALVVAVCCAVTVSAQQVADTLFVPAVGSRAYAEGKGPVVLIDEAHHNFHTAGGRYLAFARTLRSDGYDVRPSTQRFDQASLAPARVLVIANALAAENTDEWVLPNPSAFDSLEIAAVAQWVRDGGSLFLIADHMPFPGAAMDLAAAFGVHMINGFALAADQPGGRIHFRSDGGALGDHPITRGRNQRERIHDVVSFTGQAMRVVGPHDAVLTLQRGTTVALPTVAWQFSKLTPEFSAEGLLQGVALRFGKGRVAVFGEAAMFSAQLAGPERTPMGMNEPEARENAQLLLNILHWLDGSL